MSSTAALATLSTTRPRAATLPKAVLLALPFLPYHQH